MTDLSYATDAWETGPLNEPSRWMCSRVLVEDQWAIDVFERLCIPRVDPLPPSPGIDLVALARHAAWAIADERSTLGRVTACLLAAVAVPLLAWPLGIPWLLVAVLSLFLVALASVTLVRRRAARDAAGREVARPDGPYAAGDVTQDQMDRVLAANEGNLLLYDGPGSADAAPAAAAFPGLGQLVKCVLGVPVDRTRRLDPAKDAVDPTPLGLLNHVARNLHHQFGRSQIGELRAPRLMVHMLRSEATARLARENGGRIPAEAPRDLVYRAADSPERGVRTYLRAQVVGHDGQIVTTVHVGAAKGAGRLSLDLIVHVMRPVDGSWREPAAAVPKTGRGRWWRIVRRPETWVLIPLAPVDWWRLVRLQRRADDPARAEPRLADSALRQRASEGSRLEFTEFTDLSRQTADLLHAVLGDVRGYLEACNIDGGPLAAREQEVVKEVMDAMPSK